MSLRVLPSFSKIVSQYIIKWFLTAVRQEVNSSVVVHELEFAMKRAL